MQSNVEFEPHPASGPTMATRVAAVVANGSTPLSFFSKTAPSATARRATARCAGVFKRPRLESLTNARPSKRPAANLDRSTFPAARSSAACKRGRSTHSYNVVKYNYTSTSHLRQKTVVYGFWCERKSLPTPIVLDTELLIETGAHCECSRALEASGYAETGRAEEADVAVVTRWRGDIHRQVRGDVRVDASCTPTYQERPRSCFPERAATP